MYHSRPPRGMWRRYLPGMCHARRYQARLAIPAIRAFEVYMTIEEIAALEQQWIGQVDITQPDVYFDWQPAPIDLFVQLLDYCLPYVPATNQTFLDVGGGIGTKCELAQQAGLTAYNIDRVSEYIAEAISIGISSEQVLAEDYTSYGNYGLVYMNHPLISPLGDNAQALLANSIHDQVASGSVFLSINYDLAPGCTAHLPDRACDENCPIDVFNGWTEVARQGPWNAGWVKS